MEEIWKDVPMFEGLYKVSNTGKVISYVKNKDGQYIGSPDKNNYTHIQLRKKGFILFTFAHRLVAELFVPNPENKSCVNHKDFNRQNNVFTNLEWVTPYENSMHSIKNLHFNGTIRGELHPRSLFTNDQVADMRRLRSEGMMYSKIARKYNAKENTILQIFRRNGYTNPENNHI